MQSYKIAIGMYSSLPRNAADSLQEQIYQSAWRPFLSSLYKFPSIKALIHFSGTIYSWLEKNHPEYLYLLTEMARKNQIELLGGGFHSPLSALISTQDLTGQVEALSAYLRKCFGKRPSGAWLYEYSWAPSIPAVLQNSKVQYTFLPAEQLLELHIPLESCMPILSEDHRKLVSIFPVFECQNSGHSCEPFESALTRVQTAHPDCRSFIIMADGVQIANSWQNCGIESPDLLFEMSFAWFQKNCLEYETVLVSQLYRSARPERTMYFAQCYSERYLRYCRSCLTEKGTPSLEHIQLSRQTAIEHPLTRALFQKMNFVSTMTGLFRGDKSRKKLSTDDIWQAQCGELFWISPSGGILRPESRLGAYASLIEAEKTIRQNRTPPSFSFDDIDFDGKKEILYHSQLYNCYIQESRAAVIELDLLKKGINLAAGWNPASKKTGCFLDRICERSSFDSTLAHDDEPWILYENQKDVFMISLTRDFRPRMSNGKGVLLHCRKSFTFDHGCVSIDYELSNTSHEPVTLRFCTSSELMLEPQADLHRIGIVQKHQPHYLLPQNLSETAGAEAIEISGTRTQAKISLRSDTPCSIRCTPQHIPGLFRESAPAEQYQAAGNGLPHDERLLFQGFSIDLGWDFEIPAEGTVLFSVSMHMDN